MKWNLKIFWHNKTCYIMYAWNIILLTSSVTIVNVSLFLWSVLGNGNGKSISQSLYFCMDVNLFQFFFLICFLLFFVSFLQDCFLSFSCLKNNTFKKVKFYAIFKDTPNSNVKKDTKSAIFIHWSNDNPRQKSTFLINN